jgi:hypothetical protein
MKCLPPFLVAAAALAAAGCANVADDVRARLQPDVAPHVQVFAADPKAAYAAALAALDQMDFRYTHGGPAQGELEAISSIRHESDGDRQVSLAAEFRVAADGGTEVSVRMKEAVEADPDAHLGQGVEGPLRDTPLYAVFFRAIDQELAARK